jgi:hypothetical protein
MIIRRKHWYPVDACHRCKGIGSELKKNKKIYLLPNCKVLHVL